MVTFRMHEVCWARIVPEDGHYLRDRPKRDDLVAFLTDWLGKVGYFCWNYEEGSAVGQHRL